MPRQPHHLSAPKPEIPLQTPRSKPFRFTLFCFPYLVTPLLATLTQTPGVYTNNSQFKTFGVRQSGCRFYGVSHTQTHPSLFSVTSVSHLFPVSVLNPFPASFDLQLPAPSFEGSTVDCTFRTLFCTLQKPASFFSIASALFCSLRGVGGPHFSLFQLAPSPS